MIRLPPETAQDGWRTLFRLGERHGDAWTLIGAQMVALYTASAAALSSSTCWRRMGSAAAPSG